MDPRPCRSSAVSLVGVGVNAPAAEAASGNIDPNRSTSLTINKYDGDQGPRGDGTKIEDPSSLGTPLAGVEFTITPVTQRNSQAIDLKTDAGWNLIDGATIDNVTEGNGYTFGTPITVTTDANGQVTQDLPFGLYKVEETGSGDNNIISPARFPSSPFRFRRPVASGSMTSTSTRRTRRTRRSRPRRSRAPRLRSSATTSPGRSPLRSRRSPTTTSTSPSSSPTTSIRD